MNSSIFNSTLITEGGGMDYIAIGGWGLFLISELMPFLKKTDKGNGILHMATCLLRGSKCMVDNALNVMEKSDTEGAEEDKV